ncbi:hypothetical protein M427DRAFT_73129 [Gonapodya prolifera JEL478]|uniref:F-box domain-containing protein n=1 Tax=Gonapodya prolifera (strain JEL478) TaxID=1344416 RepID=A0A139A2Z2_GONPJ|nr:hypothetical protein M427DRAFT_73129 [Gonapodya prolifera JEL478]|eukprot:KXS11152.1 hypothetical protein M427DRAFT_73129 [Gonapodya prolifera JEL478]
MPSPTLTSLPVELLLPIATLLPVRSVIHLLSTSSLLRRILTYPHLWTTLDYSEFGSTLGDAKLETSLRWIERSTHLEHAHRSPPLHRVRAIILDGTFIAGRTLLSCLDRFPELRYLSVRGTARDALDWFFAEIWKQSPHATSKLAHFDMSDPTNHNQFSPRAYASFRAIAFSQFPALVIFLPRSAEMWAQIWLCDASPAFTASHAWTAEPTRRTRPLQPPPHHTRSYFGNACNVPLPGSAIDAVCVTRVG